MLLTWEKPINIKNADKRIAFIPATWHREIVDQAKLSFVLEATKPDISKEQIDFFEVPGSLEIPLYAKLLAKKGTYSIIVATGMIVDGGIYRHEFVAKNVLDAMMQVQLETEIPILSVVLTPKIFRK